MPLEVLISTPPPLLPPRPPTHVCQAAFRAGCVEVLLDNLGTTRASVGPGGGAGSSSGALRRSTVLGSGTPGTPSTPGSLGTPYPFATPALAGAGAGAGAGASAGGPSRASDADVVTVITNSFQLLTIMLVSPEIVAAAKAAGCIPAILEGYKRCARSRSLQGFFCQVRG